MKKKRIHKTHHLLSIALVSLAMLVGIVWFLDSLGTPRPLSSGAAGLCDPESLASNSAAGYDLVASEVEDSADPIVVDAELRNNSTSGFPASCNYGAMEFLFLYQAPAPPLTVPKSIRNHVGVKRENGKVVALTGSDSRTVSKAISSSFTGPEYTVKVYLVSADDPNPSLGRSNLIGQATITNPNASTPDRNIEIEADAGRPTDDLDPNTDTDTGYDLVDTSKDKTKKSAASSLKDPTGACDSEYFTYDSKTGLCLPKGGKTSSDNVYELIAKIIKTLLAFAGIITVIMVIVGGYFYITSAGNEEQAGKGHKTITYALIGLAVVILSYAIVSAVTSFVTTTTV